MERNSTFIRLVSLRLILLCVVVARLSDVDGNDGVAEVEEEAVVAVAMHLIRTGRSGDW